MVYIAGMRLGAAAVAILGLSLSSAHAESLREALTSAYAHSPSINSALASVKIASEVIALNKAGTRPVLGLGGSVSDNFGSAAGVTQHKVTAAPIGLSYTQKLFDNHATDAKVEQARANVEAAKQALRSTESTVLLNAVQAYMNVILYTQLVQLRGDTIQFYQSQVKASQDKQNIGEGTKIDVAEAQASLASAVASQKAAIASLQAAEASYVQYVGHKPRNLSSDFNYGTLIPGSVDRAIAVATSNNPSILAAKAAVRAAAAGVDEAAAAFGPSVSASGQVGPSFSTVCTSGSGCTGGTPAFGGSMSLSFALPVYAGGALGASQREATMNQAKSEFDTQAATAAVVSAAATAWSTLQNASAQISSANTAVDAYQLAMQGVIQERDVGQKTTLDVLTAESTLITYKESLITANASRVTAAFSLISAMGKMSPDALRLNTPVKSATRYVQMVEDTWEELRAFEPLPRPAWHN